MQRMTLMAFVFMATPVGAQMAPPLSRAAATITAGDVARRIGLIADASMLGRHPPSRGLGLPSRYVAAQFRGFGLEPGGEHNSWFQRYPITRRRLDLGRSRVVFTAAGREDT